MGELTLPVAVDSQSHDLWPSWDTVQGLRLLATSESANVGCVQSQMIVSSGCFMCCVCCVNLNLALVLGRIWNNKKIPVGLRP